jgi:hypothetical protein
MGKTTSGGTTVAPPPNAGVTDGEIERNFAPGNLATSDVSGGSTFPIRYAAVTRVDPKKMVVDLKPLSGPTPPCTEVPLAFPGAGNRHFMGAIPEVGDLCVIGHAPSESGRSKRPVILGWFVPSTQAGYDWLNVRSHAPDQLGLSPKEQEVLEGIASIRRHKLRQIEKGNIVCSSSQGSDLLLTESATLANRRGNELILRDQDQALVVRTLQQFHAGAGFRTYSGMVQRDANLLPPELTQDSVDWAGDRQVDEAEYPLRPEDLPEDEDDGQLQTAAVYEEGSGLAFPPVFSPQDILRRGLFVDSDGTVSGGLGDGSMYGGKPTYRVSVDKGVNGKHLNGVLNTGDGIFTEYRIEVAHHTDGTLPVTEQTDGLDIDRLLPKVPNEDPAGSGGPGGGVLDPTNLSPNAPMVEMVLGTAVGNDPFNFPEQYGLPLVKGGGGLRAATPSDPLSKHMAFLVKVRDPENPTRISFVGFTKGGQWIQQFGGKGSPSIEEDYVAGKATTLGMTEDGMSQKTEALGAISLVNTGDGRQSDNVGVEISSVAGAVSISGGGASTAGAADGGTNPQGSPAAAGLALTLRSKQSAEVAAVGKLNLTGKEVTISNTSVTSIGASSSVEVNSGDAIALMSKTFGLTCNGLAEFVFGGPKNSLPTNGSCRSTSFTSTPLTGGLGGAVDEYSVVFGMLNEGFKVGARNTEVKVGSINMVATGSALPQMSPGVGAKIVSGVPGLDNGLQAIVGAGCFLKSMTGLASVQAATGSAMVSGTAGTLINSLATVSAAAPFIHMTAPGMPGGVISDGCLDSMTGLPMLVSGTVGAPGFRLN